MASTSTPLPKDNKHTTLEDTKDLSTKNMKQLKAIAKELKMKQYSKLVKSELIDAIMKTNDNYYDGAKNDVVVGKKKMKDKEEKTKSESKKAIKPKEPKEPKEKKVSTNKDDMKTYR